MFRSIITYTFLILANFVLMLHAMVPHHHHEEKVCFEESNCEDAQACNDEAEERQHHHDDDRQYLPCILKTLVILPSDNHLQELKSFIYQPRDISSRGFDVVHDHEQSLIPNEGIITGFSVPLSCLLFSEFAGSGSGLRAPPIV